MKWIKPWIVVVTLALVAAAGATTVYFVARAQHDRDQRDIRAWLRDRYPAARRASELVTAQRSLLDRSPDKVATVVKISLRRLNGDAAVLFMRPLPQIMSPVTVKYLAAIADTQDALTGAHLASADGTIDQTEKARFTALLNRAESAFKAADDAKRDLVCRARLPECST